MADNKKRSIQFRRNVSQIYPSATIAKNAILSSIAVKPSEYCDGEQIFGRYYYTVKEGTSEITKIATLVGLIYSSGDTFNVTFSDATEGNKNTITGGSVNDVDITLSTGYNGTSFSVTVSGDNVPVGDNYDSITYNSGFTASTVSAVSKSDDVDTAIGKVEKAVSALVDEVLNNEKVVSKAITQLNDSAGFDENGKYTGGTADKHYISGTTDLTNAVETLDASLYNVKEGSISKVEIDQVTSGTTHQYTASDADLYQVSATTQDGKTTVDDFQLTFTPYSPSGLTVPVTIGDITVGTKASELNGKTISKILDDILFKTIFPTLTVLPTCKNSWNGFTDGGLYVYGTTAPTSGTNITKSFTSGKYTIADGIHTTPTAYTVSNADYTVHYNGASGVTVTSSSTNVTYSTSAASTDTTILPSTVMLGTMSYRTTAQYASSTTVILDSKGNTATKTSTDASLSGKNPDTGGTVSASTLTIKGTLPVSANSGSSYTATISRLPLKEWGVMTYGTDGNKTSGVHFGAVEPTTPIKLYMPRQLSSFKGWDSTANKFSFDYTSNFSLNIETINNLPYYVYTWNKGTVSYDNYYQIKTV